MYSRRWLIAVLAVCGLAAGCSQFNTNLTVQTSSSTLTFVSPGSATVGGPGFTLTANGGGFVTGAIVLWNGTQLPTLLVSASQLTATVPASNIATAGTAQVAVQIPGSAVSGASGTTATTTTEVSDFVNFTVRPVPGPLPTIASISASSTSMPSTPYCQPNGITLTVNGTNFVNGATTVNWNGSPRVTTFASSTQVTALILPTDTASLGTASVSVSTATGPSNSLTFTMTTPLTLATYLPAPTITSLPTTSVPAGTPTFTLVITGGSFAPCSAVQWNGSPRATAFVNTTQLNATITAADVFSAGTVNVTVFTLSPGGGTTSPIMFTITP